MVDKHIFDGRDPFQAASVVAAQELLAGSLGEARKGLIDQITPIRDALCVAGKSHGDAKDLMAAFERNRDAMEALGARVFAAHVYLNKDDEHPDALSGGELCALAQERPREPSARQYAEYVDEVLTAITNMKAAA